MKTSHHQMRIELSTSEGAMLRALGLMERRGYVLDTCQLHAPAGDSKMLDIVVISDRPADLLKRQLERLHDVRSVTLKTHEQNQTISRLGQAAPA